MVANCPIYGYIEPDEEHCSECEDYYEGTCLNVDKLCEKVSRESKIRFKKELRSKSGKGFTRGGRLTRYPRAIDERSLEARTMGRENGDIQKKSSEILLRDQDIDTTPPGLNSEMSEQTHEDGNIVEDPSVDVELLEAVELSSNMNENLNLELGIDPLDQSENEIGLEPVFDKIDYFGYDPLSLDLGSWNQYGCSIELDPLNPDPDFSLDRKLDLLSDVDLWHGQFRHY